MMMIGIGIPISHIRIAGIALSSAVDDMMFAMTTPELLAGSAFISMLLPRTPPGGLPGRPRCAIVAGSGRTP